jgi:membrane fusion protein, heavy metal efflux system
MTECPTQRRSRSRRIQTAIVVVIVAVAGALAWSLSRAVNTRAANGHPGLSDQIERARGAYFPTTAQWATLTVEPVTQQVFRSEAVTEGKIAVDEDRSTLIFSPYSGRVTSLLAKPGDEVARGQPLFVIEATDMVQAQNDFIAAVAAKNKARSQLAFAEIDERRHRTLYSTRAVPLRDFEQAQAALVAAQNDVRATETALEAVRNRLRILGRTDDEITAFEQTGKISPATPIPAPIAGTIVQRKVGPGQYISSGTSDAAFVIGDLSTVWLIAYVRETEAPRVHIGQQIDFTVLAYPDEIFRGNISYVAATLDSSSRRLLVRATVQNSKGLLKPEMFAIVGIFTDEGDVAPAVPRDAMIYEGSTAHVWVARSDNAIELRQVKPGVTNGRMVQVLDGLQPGEKVVTKGNIFIDRAAAGS